MGFLNGYNKIKVNYSKCFLIKIEVPETKQVTAHSVISNQCTVHLLVMTEFVNQFTLHGMNNMKVATHFG